MHRTAHIGAATIQPVNRVLLPAVKATDDGRFRETFGANIRPVVASSSAGQEQPHQGGTEAQSGKPTPAVAAPVAAAMQRGPEPLQGGDDAGTEPSGTAKDEVNPKSVAATPSPVINANPTALPLTQPSIGAAMPKKALHKSVEKESTESGTPATDGAALVPAPNSDQTLRWAGCERRNIITSPRTAPCQQRHCR